MEVMTLKELMDYEKTLCNLQREYEAKLHKRTATPNERRKLVIILNLIIQERQKVNRQQYKPV